MLKVKENPDVDGLTLADVSPGTMFKTLYTWKLGMLLCGIPCNKWQVVWFDDKKCEEISLEYLRKIYIRPLEDNTEIVYKKP